jgi:hypothetical protein
VTDAFGDRFQCKDAASGADLHAHTLLHCTNETNMAVTWLPPPFFLVSTPFFPHQNSWPAVESSVRSTTEFVLCMQT